MSNKKIKSLEGLRAIAFIGVLYNHSGFDSLICKAGYWSVSFFFVLSGFVSFFQNDVLINKSENLTGGGKKWPFRANISFFKKDI